MMTCQQLNSRNPKFRRFLDGIIHPLTTTHDQTDFTDDRRCAITNSSNLVRFADSCGADIPRYVRRQLSDFGDDRKAIREFGFGVVHRLCERLISEGVPAMHFYSMNKVEPNKRLVESLGLIA